MSCFGDPYDDEEIEEIEDNLVLITRKSSEFYSKLQRYIFINPITEKLTKPMDIDDILTFGVPMENDTEYELYAIVVENNDD